MDVPQRTPPENGIWNRPLSQLRGVGPERSGQLARLGLGSVGDLLLHRPRRYEDRRRVLRIAELQLHQSATISGRIAAMGVKRFARGRKSLFELIVDDGSARLHCRWWNLPYMQNYFTPGSEVLVFGRPVGLKPRTMDHPETEVIEDGVEPSIHLNRIAPVYPLTEGLPQRWLRSLIWRTLELAIDAVAEPWPLQLAAGRITRKEAIRYLHFPAELSQGEQARQRLALDELVEFQSSLQHRRRNLLARSESRPCPGDNHLIKPFLRRLQFQLTDAQTSVLREIRGDMRSGRPMRRLLQGDVGSGKTVVAACSALLAIESGCSVALMAPTEILAEQHFRTFRDWFEPLGIPVRIRTATHKADKDPQAGLLFAQVASSSQPVGAPGGTAPGALVIGTHALLEDSVTFENLGLAIIDEQHRFGVEQRERLVRKGPCPHLLVMTATPIPRTLGLTIYGDLDISVIQQLPPGRAPIKTFVRRTSSLSKVWAFLKTKLAEGRQAFVVLPRIEDTGQGVKAVKQELQALEKELSPFRVGMLHGRLAGEQKEAVMKAFRANQIQVLLSTSLVEVGIDIPNATLMVIDNADQFGLSQLHQLRGRIGRGAHESYCILISHARTEEAQARLAVLGESTDGFRIAEEDLRLRGPGDFLGREQSGLRPFRFAELSQDLGLVEEARRIAAVLVERGSSQRSVLPRS